MNEVNSELIKSVDLGDGNLLLTYIYILFSEFDKMYYVIISLHDDCDLDITHEKIACRKLYEAQAVYEKLKEDYLNDRI